MKNNQLQTFIDPSWTFPDKMKIEVATVIKKYFEKYGNDLSKKILEEKMKEIKSVFISFGYPWED